MCVLLHPPSLQGLFEMSREDMMMGGLVEPRMNARVCPGDEAVGPVFKCMWCKGLVVTDHSSVSPPVIGCRPSRA